MPSTDDSNGFFEERVNLMVKAEEFEQDWRTRLDNDWPKHNATTKESIIHWILGKDVNRFETLNPTQMEIAKQAMAYRYRILQQRYLGCSPERAYHQLITRLSSSALLRNKIYAWVALSRDRQQTVVDVLQEMIQELLQSDRYMQQQMSWIAECTEDARLRNALLFVSIEEYCLRPIWNRPLLFYRFINYLKRHRRGGITQMPSNESIRLISDQVLARDRENLISLLDAKAVSQYQDRQTIEEQQTQRTAVKQKFEQYLEEKLGKVAAQWLQLYLQGRSQKEIASRLDLPIVQVYRLMEKISYHAVRIFALKGEWY